MSLMSLMFWLLNPNLTVNLCHPLQGLSLEAAGEEGCQEGSQAEEEQVPPGLAEALLQRCTAKIQEQRQALLLLLPKEEFVCQLVQLCCQQAGEKLVVFSQVSRGGVCTAANRTETKTVWRNVCRKLACMLIVDCMTVHQLKAYTAVSAFMQTKLAAV